MEQSPAPPQRILLTVEKRKKKGGGPNPRIYIGGYIFHHGPSSAGDRRCRQSQTKMKRKPDASSESGEAKRGRSQPGGYTTSLQCIKVSRRARMVWQFLFHHASHLHKLMERECNKDRGRVTEGKGERGKERQAERQRKGERER